jgi:hypothetical protein
MTPITGATFPTAMRRSAPCLGEQPLWRTPVLVSADIGRACLLLGRPVRWRCRKNGGLRGSRAPDHRLMVVDVGLRRSGPLLEEVGCPPQPVSEPPSERRQLLSRGLIQLGAGRQMDRSSIATRRSECVSNKDWLLGFPRPRWLRPFAVCERPHRSAARVRPTHSAIRDFSGRLSASARSRFARGKPVPSGFSRSTVKGPRRPLEASVVRAAAGSAVKRPPSELGRLPGNFGVPASTRLRHYRSSAQVCPTRSWPNE